VVRRAALCIVAVLVVGCGGDSALAPVVPTARQPIVFIHGIGGSARDWDLPIARFKADGWVDRELIAASYSSAISNAAIADEIRRRVDSVLVATASAKVDVIAFSMGSVSSRYYLRNLGGDAKVDAWVSVAGPNHGTETANSCSIAPCIEIRPGSAFLANLNSGDEERDPDRRAEHPD
jgi:triacylglycerol lipase